MDYKKRKAKKLEKYIANDVPLSQRLFNKIAIVFLIGYGSYGIYSETLYLPLWRGEVTLQGNAVYFGFASLILGAGYLLVEIIDHYDKRNNEFSYERIKAIILGLASLILLFTIAISAALSAPKLQ